MVARSVTLSGKKTPCPHCPVSAAAAATAVAAAAERLFNPTCWTEQPIVYNKLILFIAWWRVILRGAFILTTVYESTWLFSAASVSIYQILFKNSGVICKRYYIASVAATDAAPTISKTMHCFGKTLFPFLWKSELWDFLTRKRRDVLSSYLHVIIY